MSAAAIVGADVDKHERNEIIQGDGFDNLFTIIISQQQANWNIWVTSDSPAEVELIGHAFMNGTQPSLLWASGMYL